MREMGVPWLGGRVEGERVIPKYRSEIILIKNERMVSRGTVFYQKPFAKSRSFGKNRPLFRAALFHALCCLFLFHDLHRIFVSSFLSVKNSFSISLIKS